MHCYGHLIWTKTTKTRTRTTQEQNICPKQVPVGMLLVDTALVAATSNGRLHIDAITVQICG